MASSRAARRRSLDVCADALTPLAPPRVPCLPAPQQGAAGCSPGVRLSRRPCGWAGEDACPHRRPSFRRSSELRLPAGRTSTWPLSLLPALVAFPYACHRSVGLWCWSDYPLSREVSTKMKSRRRETAWGCQALSRLQALLRGCKLVGTGLRLAVSCPWRGQALSQEKGAHCVYGCLSASVLFAVRTVVSEKGDSALPGACLNLLGKEFLQMAWHCPRVLGGASHTRSLRQTLARGSAHRAVTSCQGGRQREEVGWRGGLAGRRGPPSCCCCRTS